MVLQVAKVMSELVIHEREMEQIRRLGKELVEDPRTGDVRSLKDTLSACENNWGDLRDLLQQSEREMTLRVTRSSKYDEVKGEVFAWLGEKEEHVDSLEPVAIALDIIIQQTQELQVMTAT